MLQALKNQADGLIESAREFGLELVIEGDKRYTATYEAFIAKAEALIAEYENEIQFAFECLMFLASNGQKVVNMLTSDRAVRVYKTVIRLSIWLLIELFDLGAHTVEVGRLTRDWYDSLKAESETGELSLYEVVAQNVETAVRWCIAEADYWIWYYDAQYQELVERVKARVASEVRSFFSLSEWIAFLMLG